MTTSEISTMCTHNCEVIRITQIVKIRLLYVFVSALVLSGSVVADTGKLKKAADFCKDMTEIARSNKNSVAVDDSTINILEKHFISFNLEWIGFQHSYWDSDKKEVDRRLVGFLKDHFQGSLYRYPGGTISNNFDWAASIGNVSDRKEQKPVSWKSPMVVVFGFDEYLDFVNEVEGVPWIVANIKGDYYEEHDISSLSDQAFKWANYAKKNQAGIFRWELGNELDRGKYRWNANKYSKRAESVTEAIRRADPSTKFVSMMRDFELEGPGSSKAYNSKIAEKTRKIGAEYALHQYYDAPKGGPSVRNRLYHVCNCLAEIKKKTDNEARIWITEHARAPVKIETGWQKHFSKTNDMHSAISVADYVIGLTQISEVKGAFIHSISHTNGPWSLFHDINGVLKPSIVYWALRMFRDSFNSHVLDVDIKSRNDSKYNGYYDVRASVLSNEQRSKYSIWLVNRSKEESEIILDMPNLSSKSYNVELTHLSSNDLANNNMYSDKQKYIMPEVSTARISFDPSGKAVLKVPGYSISTLAFNVEQSTRNLTNLLPDG
jgi:alpha-L-arabinofuranosidase